MDFCSIASGSSGNCIFAGSDCTSLLIDTGIAGKKIKEGLALLDRKPEELDAILITHEHSDHIKGLGVMARKYGTPIYATQGTIDAMLEKNMLGKVDPSLFHTVTPDQSFVIGDMTVYPFQIPHDAAAPAAYRVEHGGKSLAVATDLGFYDDYILSYLQNLDAILLEANHDVNMLQVGSYPYYLKQRILGDYGHLSNETAGRLLSRILHDRIRHIFLGHLSKENNFEELALMAVRAEITMGDNPYQASDFDIRVAHRDLPTEAVVV